MKRLLFFARKLMPRNRVHEMAQAELAREEAARKFSEQVRQQRESIARAESILSTIAGCSCCGQMETVDAAARRR